VYAISDQSYFRRGATATGSKKATVRRLGRMDQDTREIGSRGVNTAKATITQRWASATRAPSARGLSMVRGCTGGRTEAHFVAPTRWVLLCHKASILQPAKLYNLTARCILTCILTYARMHTCMKARVFGNMCTYEFTQMA